MLKIPILWEKISFYLLFWNCLKKLWPLSPNLSGNWCISWYKCCTQHAYLQKTNISFWSTWIVCQKLKKILQKIVFHFHIKGFLLTFAHAEALTGDILFLNRLFSVLSFWSRLSHSEQTIPFMPYIHMIWRVYKPAGIRYFSVLYCFSTRTNSITPIVSFVVGTFQSKSSRTGKPQPAKCKQYTQNEEKGKEKGQTCHEICPFPTSDELLLYLASLLRSSLSPFLNTCFPNVHHLLAERINWWTNKLKKGKKKGIFTSLFL